MLPVTNNQHKPHSIACHAAGCRAKPAPKSRKNPILQHPLHPLQSTQSFHVIYTSTTTQCHSTTHHTAPPPQTYTIKPASTLRHLQQTARLRADAYYEEQPTTRFVDTFKRQFAEQELQSLCARTGVGRPVAQHLQCVCLVALDAQGDVQGCVDVRPPACHTGVVPKGVTNDDSAGGYLLNVVVHEDHRRQGLGAQLVWAARSHAAQALGALRMYTHVDAQNDGALRLYERCGFVQCEVVGGVGGTSVGKQLALVMDL